MNEPPKTTSLKTWILAIVIVWMFWQVTKSLREQAEAKREVQELHDSAWDGITQDDVEKWSQPRDPQ